MQQIRDAVTTGAHALANSARHAAQTTQALARRALNAVTAELRERNRRCRVRDGRVPWMPLVRWTSAKLVWFSAGATVFGIFSPVVLAVAVAWPAICWLVWTAPTDRVI